MNSEPRLINLFISFLKYLGIKKERLSFRIIFNKKILFKMKINKKDLEKNSKIFWNKIANVEQNNYRKFNYSGTLKGSLRKESPIYGSLAIEYCSTIFRAFLKELLKETKNNLTNKKEITAYLRGFIAGEAYVGKKDREIQIASTDLEELNFVKELFNKINIKCSISKETSTSPPRIIITNLKSFLILESFGIFKFHPLKKEIY